MEKITEYLIQSTVHTSEVRAWEEIVMLPTYGIGKEEKNPVFLEKKVFLLEKPGFFTNIVNSNIKHEFTRKSKSCL